MTSTPRPDLELAALRAARSLLGAPVTDDAIAATGMTQRRILDELAVVADRSLDHAALWSGKSRAELLDEFEANLPVARPAALPPPTPPTQRVGSAPAPFAVAFAGGFPGATSIAGCADLIALAEHADRWEVRNQVAWWNTPTRSAAVEDVLQLMAVVNAESWGIPLRSAHCRLARYDLGVAMARHVDYLRPGDSEMPEHVRLGVPATAVSASVQLSDPDTYDGGDLVLVGDDGQEVVAPRARGSVVVFTGLTEHRVTAVTRGRRYSLVMQADAGTIREALEDGTWPRPEAAEPVAEAEL